MQNLQSSKAALEKLLEDSHTLEQILKACQLLSGVFSQEGRVFSCGNGGSMADAIHFAEELTGKYKLPRPALAAIAISDPGYLSCVANDYSYEEVFSRFIEGHGRKNDALLAITTSGQSKNVIKAAQCAKQKNMSVIALIGPKKSPLCDLADVVIQVPAEDTERIQELHIKVIHNMIELIERNLFPENYRR